MSFESIPQEIGERHDESPQEKVGIRKVQALLNRLNRIYAWIDSCPDSDKIESIKKKKETLEQIAQV